MVDLSLYDSMKDHPAVKKLNLDIGLPHGDNFYEVIEKIEYIDNFLKENQTRNYDDVFKNIYHKDDEVLNYAFLLHIEGKYNTTITDASQLHQLAEIKDKPIIYYPPTGKFTTCFVDCLDDIKNLYDSALWFKYRLVLEKILLEGGKYKDLIDTSPRDYGLTESRKNDNHAENKETSIRQALASFIERRLIDELDPHDEVNPEDLMREIEADPEVFGRALQYSSYEDYKRRIKYNLERIEYNLERLKQFAPDYKSKPAYKNVLITDETLDDLSFNFILDLYATKTTAERRGDSGDIDSLTQTYPGLFSDGIEELIANLKQIKGI